MSLRFWPLLIAMAALMAHGFSTPNLFADNLWNPGGWARFCYFAVGFTSWSVAGFFLFRRFFLPATGTAAAAYAVAVAGPLPVAAVALFLVAAWAVGTLASPGVRGLVAGVAAYSFLAGFAVFLPVNYPVVYALAMLPPLYRLRRRWTWPALGAPRSPAEFFAAALLCGVLVSYLLMALKPESGTDALAMHLAIPAGIAQNGRFPFDFQHTAWALMPMNADWAFTIVYLLGGEAATGLFNFAMLAAVALLLLQLLQRVTTRGSALLFTALFASSPIVQLVTGSLFVENFWAALSLAAFASIVSYRDSGEPREARLAAALLGAMLATKYGALSFFAPAVLVLGLELRRRKAVRLVPSLSLLALVFAMQPYARAYWVSGNPIYPFFNHIFQSPFFDATAPFVDVRFTTPLSFTVLYDLTFHTRRYLEGRDGGWAFQYLFFLPLALVYFRKGTSYLQHAALAISIPCAILSLAGQSNARYLYPVLPLFTILAAGVPSAVGGGLRRVSLLFAALALCGLNLYFLPASGWAHADFDAPSQDLAPVRNLIAYMNREHPGEPAAFLETSQTAGFRGKAYTSSWHHNAFYQGMLKAESVEDCYELLRSRNIQWILAPSDPTKLRLTPWSALLSALPKPVYQYMGWAIYRLRDAVNLAPLAVLEPGAYDDMDPAVEFTGKWTRDLQFAEAHHHSLTYSSSPQARLRVRFRGSAVTYFYTKAPNRGIVEVRIDGKPAGELDQYSAQVQWRRQARYENLGAGEHTIEVIVTGRRNPAADGAFADLDLLTIDP